MVGTSRWRRNKTWRSPSSSQIHQKYILLWNNSWRTPTERWQKTSDFLKGKKLPTYLGKAKETRKKNETKELGWDLHLWEGAVKEEKFPHTREPLPWGRQEVGGGEASGPWRRAQQQGRRVQQQGCRGQSRDIPTKRISADQHSPTWDACLFTHWGRWGLGAEAQASEVRSQGEDWGWLHED